jgi:hypothetical protein
LRLAPPPAPSATRSLTWAATSSPRHQTVWTIASGPGAGSWRTSCGASGAKARRSAAEAHRATPVEAVATGRLAKTGNRSQAERSSAEATTVVGGCGRPRRSSVADAAALSCTAARAENGGTAVQTPAAATRSAAALSAAACSWVGTSTS